MQIFFIIKKDKLNEYCPKCNNTETWEHVMQCLRIIATNDNFILQFFKKLKKIDKEKED